MRFLFVYLSCVRSWKKCLHFAERFLAWLIGPIRVIFVIFFSFSEEKKCPNAVDFITAKKFNCCAPQMLNYYDKMNGDWRRWRNRLRKTDQFNCIYIFISGNPFIAHQISTTQCSPGAVNGPTQLSRPVRRTQDNRTTLLSAARAPQA